MAGFLPPVVAELVAKTDEFTSELGKARGEMSKTTSAGSKAFSGLASVGKAALMGLGGAAVAVGTFGVEMADKYETAHARLVTALDNTNTSWDKQRTAIAAVEKTATHFGENQTQVEDALAIMTRGMGSSTKAIGLFGVVQDVAAATGKDLSTSAIAVTKASEGQLRPLKQLGIDLPIAAAGAVKLQKAHDTLSKAQNALAIVQAKVHAGLLKGVPAYLALAKAQGVVRDAQDKVNTVASAGDQIIAALGQKLSGSAAAQADTFKGKVDALKAQIDNLGIKIGMWLIPKLEQLAVIVQKVIVWFGKHQTAAKTLGVIVGTVLVVAIGAYVASMVSAAAATIAATWPILAIVAVVALLVVGIVYAWTHWNQIWNWIKNHPAYAALIAIFSGGLIPIIFGIIVAAKWVQAHWGTIWSDMQAVAGGAASIISGVVDGIVTAFDWTVQQIIRILNDAIQAYNDIPFHKDIGKISLPGSGGTQANPITNPHQKALGGPVEALTPYLVGERGPEMFVPRGAGSIVPNNALGGGSPVFHIEHLTVMANNPLELASALDQAARVTGQFSQRTRQAMAL